MQVRVRTGDLLEALRLRRGCELRRLSPAEARLPSRTHLALGLRLIIKIIVINYNGLLFLEFLKNIYWHVWSPHSPALKGRCFVLILGLKKARVLRG